jgi:hypothetical protein
MTIPATRATSTDRSTVSRCRAGTDVVGSFAEGYHSLLWLGQSASGRSTTPRAGQKQAHGATTAIRTRTRAWTRMRRTAALSGHDRPARAATKPREPRHRTRTRIRTANSSRSPRPRATRLARPSAMRSPPTSRPVAASRRSGRRRSSNRTRVAWEAVFLERGGSGRSLRSCRAATRPAVLRRSARQPTRVAARCRSTGVTTEAGQQAKAGQAAPAQPSPSRPGAAGSVRRRAARAPFPPPLTCHLFTTRPLRSCVSSLP